jgi:hypothetical protein
MKRTGLSIGPIPGIKSRVPWLVLMIVGVNEVVCPRDYCYSCERLLS